MGRSDGRLAVRHVRSTRDHVGDVSAEVGYQRRWLGNFQGVDNFNRGVEDHTVFGVNVPADSRLPDGGGYVLEGLYNVTTTGAARLNDNVTTLASNYGDWSQVAELGQLERHRAAARWTVLSRRLQCREDERRTGVISERPYRR